MRFIDNKVDFLKYNAEAKYQKKTIRQSFIDEQAEIEKRFLGKTELQKDFANLTHVIKDSNAGLYPVDAFQVLDLTVNLPLNKYWAQELVPMRYGGGAVESVAFFRQNIALGEGRLAGGNTNEIPLVGGSDQKIVVPIYAIKLGILLGMVDLMKSEQINYDLLERHEMALRTSYWREIEYFAFEGNVNIGDITTSTTNFKAGLLNIPISGQGIYYKVLTDALWSTYDVAKWTQLFVEAVAQMKVNLRYERDLFPNTIALPPSVWTLLQSPAVIGAVGDATGAGIATSIMQYVQREINSRLQINVEFVELPYLDAGAKATLGFPIEASGANQKGRIVVYHKGERALKLPIPMGLTGGATLPSPTEDGLRKNYVAFAGPLMLVYPEAIGYIDNKAS
jgi:hypothetical protein